MIWILTAARELVKQGWTQGAWARDAQGWPLDKQSDEAVCFCVTGAIWRAAAGSGQAYQAEKAFRVEAAGGSPIPYWNDMVCKSQDEALAAFDVAIRGATLMAAFNRSSVLTNMDRISERVDKIAAKIGAGVVPA